MPLEYSRTTEAGVVICSLKGRLDARGALALRDCLEPLLEQKPRGIVLECRHIDEIGLEAMGYLLSVVGRLQEHGGRLKFSGLHPRVARTFLEHKLNRILELFDNPKSAVLSFGPE